MTKVLWKYNEVFGIFQRPHELEGGTGGIEGGVLVIFARGELQMIGIDDPSDQRITGKAVFGYLDVDLSMAVAVAADENISL